MINNKEILYIKQGNRESIIYTINGKIVVNDTIDRLINKWCIDSLSTYTGRIDAIKCKYNLKKLVPIYVNKDLMLFPIGNTKTVDNIYINSVNILEISKMENKTKIVFNNYDQIMVDKKYQLINNYYQRCLRIYNLI